MPNGIDQAALDGLIQMTGGDPEFLGELIDTYVTEAADLIASARAALATSDAEALRRATHSLKSSSASLGAHALAGLCQGIEQQAKAGDLTDAPNVLDTIAAELAAVIRDLQAIRAAG